MHFKTLQPPGKEKSETGINVNNTTKQGWFERGRPTQNKKQKVPPTHTPKQTSENPKDTLKRTPKKKLNVNAKKPRDRRVT